MQEFELGAMLPFTVEELTQAHVLLGEPEDEARASWSEAIAGVAAARDSGAESWGMSLADGTLMALSLLSDELEERVLRFRANGWEHNRAAWERLLAVEEFQRRTEEHDRIEREWQDSREQLRQYLLDNPPG
jgi:hypothetical protein